MNFNIFLSGKPIITFCINYTILGLFYQLLEKNKIINFTCYLYANQKDIATNLELVEELEIGSGTDEVEQNVNVSRSNVIKWVNYRIKEY